MFIMERNLNYITYIIIRKIVPLLTFKSQIVYKLLLLIFLLPHTKQNPLILKLLENLTVTQLVKTFLILYEP
jgi:hypothetical protein